MPALAHFSIAVYDKLGHETVEELVAYMNQAYDCRAEVDELRRDVKRPADGIHTLSLRVIERLPAPPA